MTPLLSPKTIVLVLLLAGMGLVSSCNKKDFLDKKPSTDLVVPSTLEDFQALLDNDDKMSGTPVLGELSADNYYLPYSFWQNLNTREHNAYTWKRDIYEGQGQVDDWDLPYKQVFYANVVLEGLSKLAMNSSNEQQWKTLQGAALFIRAYAFYNLAQVFAPMYDSITAATDLGIPLRLSSDVNPVSVRSTMKQTYDKILSDLRAASSLLPAALPISNRNRPSKPAALALLARACLSMRAYDSAGLYADSCLQLYDVLMDYNTISNNNFPFTKLNTETLYQSRFVSTQVLVGLLVANCVVDSNLYRSYAAGDLRQALFYTINGAGLPNIKGSYTGGILAFSGLATDEIHLVRAECFARAGNISAAMDGLNALLQKRWARGSFVPFTASTAAQARDLILAERRKELAFRGIRWTDLRRLNKEGAGIRPGRVLNGVPYQLAPNDPRYVLTIPPDVIALSGIPQNP